MNIGKSIKCENQAISFSEFQKNSAGIYFNNSNKLPEQIESERLIIRVAKPGDGKVLNEAIVESSEQLKGWVPWIEPLPSIGDSESTCQQAYENFLSNKDLIVLLFLKEDGTLIGGSGLHSVNWELRHFKVGYWGRTKYLGNGLITEGVQALVNHAFLNLMAKKIYLHIDPKNVNSSKLAERVGFKLENTLYSDRLDFSGNLRNTNVYAINK